MPIARFDKFLDKIVLFQCLQSFLIVQQGQCKRMATLLLIGILKFHGDR